MFESLIITTLESPVYFYIFAFLPYFPLICHFKPESAHCVYFPICSYQHACHLAENNIACNTSKPSVP